MRKMDLPGIPSTPFDAARTQGPIITYDNKPEPEYGEYHLII